MKLDGNPFRVLNDERIRDLEPIQSLSALSASGSPDREGGGEGKGHVRYEATMMYLEFFHDSLSAPFFEVFPDGEVVEVVRPLVGLQDLPDLVQSLPVDPPPPSGYEVVLKISL
jgi:hypothetical protein